MLSRPSNSACIYFIAAVSWLATRRKPTRSILGILRKTASGRRSTTTPMSAPITPGLLQSARYRRPMTIFSTRSGRGKRMMEGTKAEWFAGILQILGQERGLKYMRELAKQQPSPREGHELLAQLLVPGERAI